MGHLSPASEFPNDNARISGGGIWVCAALTGPAQFERPIHAPVPVEPFLLFSEERADYVDGSMDLEATSRELSVVIGEGARAAPTDSSPPPPSETWPAYARFESALLKALMAEGASRAATILPRMLRLEPLPAEALMGNVQLTLQDRGYLEESGRYSRKYRELCGAWSAVLRGEARDCSACGTTTLDRFGADLLAALLAVPATRAEELRRELRKAGIAAFGVLAAA